MIALVYNFGKFSGNKIARAAAFRAGDAVKKFGMRAMTSKIDVHSLKRMEVVLVHAPQYSGAEGEKAVIAALTKAGVERNGETVGSPTFFVNLRRGELSVDADANVFFADWLEADGAEKVAA